MPALVALLWGAFGAILPSLVGRILVALGLSAVTYAGLDLVVTSAEAKILSYLSGTAAEVYGIMGYLGVIAGIKMVSATMVSIVGVTAATKSIKAVTK